MRCFVAILNWFVLWPITRCIESGQNMQSSAKMGLKMTGTQFSLDGRPFRVMSGSVQYFRIPSAYWRDRLTKLKACGLNTVETYIPWNAHEKRRGLFDFSGNLDLIKFIRLAQNLGLYVIIRPGPYICAEWDFGGLPAWLLKDANLVVRSSYGSFLSAVKEFFDQIFPLMVNLQYTKGGPIIAFQIENEYAAFGNDVTYLRTLKQMFEEAGLVEFFFVSESIDDLLKIPIPDALITANGQYDMSQSLDALSDYQPGTPLMVMEFWTGWFDHWGEKHHTISLRDYEKIFRVILDRNASFNLYPFSGGTNFGFQNGANAGVVVSENSQIFYTYEPTVTSYDFDALLAEHGEITPKYNLTKKLLKEYFPDLPVWSENYEIPQKSPFGTGPVKIPCSQKLKLGDILDSVVLPLGIIKKPNFVEFICQEIGGSCNEPLHGFVVYRKKLSDVIRPDKLLFAGVLADRMHVILNGITVKIIYSRLSYQSISFTVDVDQASNDVMLLVENMGRVNYKTLNGQRKGFQGQAKIGQNRKNVEGWAVYGLDFNENQIFDILSSNQWLDCDDDLDSPEQPTFYKFNYSHLDENEYSEKFLNFQGWNKGVAFVNSVNLGRYWSKGPQRALFLPKTFIKPRINTIIMFELEPSENTSITLQEAPSLS